MTELTLRQQAMINEIRLHGSRFVGKKNRDGFAYMELVKLGVLAVERTERGGRFTLVATEPEPVRPTLAEVEAQVAAAVTKRDAATRASAEWFAAVAEIEEMSRCRSRLQAAATSSTVTEEQVRLVEYVLSDEYDNE